MASQPPVGALGARPWSPGACTAARAGRRRSCTRLIQPAARWAPSGPCTESNPERLIGRDGPNEEGLVEAGFLGHVGELCRRFHRSMLARPMVVGGPRVSRTGGPEVAGGEPAMAANGHDFEHVGDEACRPDPAQVLGDRAESLVGDQLRAAGWTILGRNLRFGRNEVDILALDPGPSPPWSSSRSAGERAGPTGLARRPSTGASGPTCGRRRAPPRVDRVDRRHDRAAFPVRIDLVVVEPGERDGPIRVRHHRDALAS